MAKNKSSYIVPSITRRKQSTQHNEGVFYKIDTLIKIPSSKLNNSLSSVERVTIN
jgi:hypothetical protein